MPEDNEKQFVPSPEPFAPPVGPAWDDEAKDVPKTAVIGYPRAGMLGGGGIHGYAEKAPSSPYEQLLAQRARLNLALQCTEEAIKALEANPEIERVMRLVSRAL